MKMVKAVIFDVDGTLVDSVDLHAWAWRDALAEYGHPVTFDQARSQIGKGGDKLLPVFLTEAQQTSYGEEMEEWRGKHFKSTYLPMVRPFAAVPELFHRIRADGLKIAVASSAKKSELETYLAIAEIENLVDASISSEDAEQSKPESDIFDVTLQKLGLSAGEAIAIGDTPYDAEAARKAGIRAIGFLSGGFSEAELRRGGCETIYPGPASLLACIETSLLCGRQTAEEIVK
ncbi:HAD family hydrolase [Acidiphilium sp. PA]|uniref:HAD family hydrolase n=1 Tax=Acidiphilium sp. PA TaxID=2871705 RepID=UPI00224488EF|nr:HAD family hydrolase [Acidiphilium sp. PA]MCW8309363.1 HAD family hydrolase [Acidiphilium sp. PA]